MNTIEVAVGHVSSRGNFIEKDDLSGYLQEETELYRSLFVLENTEIETITEYEGRFAVDRIVYDIDIGEGTGHTCKTNAKRFYEFLLSEGVRQEIIMIWFSGRGFHIEIPNLYGFIPAEDLPLTAKRTIDKHLKKKAVFDNIYDRGRLMRVPFSYNEKSGLYKIPLVEDELFDWSYNDICKEAEKFCNAERVSFYQLRMDEFNRHAPEVIEGNTIPAACIFNKYVISHDKIEKELVQDNTVNGEALNGNVTCIQKMIKDPNKVGRRHHMMLRMASAWRRMGIPREMCYNMGSTAISSLEYEDIEDIVNRTYDKPYEFSCNDHLMSEYCDSMCRFYLRKNYGTDVKSTEQMWSNYVATVNKGVENISFNLNDVWDIGCDYRFYEGELAVLIGDTKLGKTAFMQNMVIPLTHMRVLYLTLEVHLDLLLRRFIQIANGMSKEQTIEMALSHNSDKTTEILAPLQHIYCRQSAPELSSIKELISEVQPKIVVIDTLDGINVQYANDPFIKMEKIILKLKEIANQHNIIVLAVSHIGKSASHEGLTVHSGKGNSVIEQKADKILGIEGSRDGNLSRTIKSLASRDESGFNVSFMFQPKTFRFEQIKEKTYAKST